MKPWKISNLRNIQWVWAVTVLCILLLAFSSSDGRAASQLKGADQRAAEKADELYAQGNHLAAYNKYLRLAKKGDPFSQYRASYMNLRGEGVEQDYSEAFAWAVLAAESEDQQLVQYFEEVKSLVPQEQREEAQKAAENHMRQWGKVALAIEARNKAKRELRGCTGSRLGTRCEEVYAMEMPRFWAINPAEGGSAAPSGSVSAAPTGAGGDTRDVAHYQQLREYSAELDRFIEKEAGTVELGEFEVIEPAEEQPQDQ